MEDEFGTICLTAFALAVLLARQHPHTTYVPHTWLGVGNGGGQRVRQGGIGPPPPFNPLLDPLAVVLARWHPQTTPPLVSISRRLRHSSLRRGNPTVRKI